MTFVSAQRLRYVETYFAIESLDSSPNIPYNTWPFPHSFHVFSFDLLIVWLLANCRRHNDVLHFSPEYQLGSSQLSRKLVRWILLGHMQLTFFFYLFQLTLEIKNRQLDLDLRRRPLAPLCDKYHFRLIYPGVRPVFCSQDVVNCFNGSHATRKILFSRTAGLKWTLVGRRIWFDMTSVLHLNHRTGVYRLNATMVPIRYINPLNLIRISTIVLNLLLLLCGNAPSLRDAENTLANIFGTNSTAAFQERFASWKFYFRLFSLQPPRPPLDFSLQDIDLNGISFPTISNASHWSWKWMCGGVLMTPPT